MTEHTIAHQVASQEAELHHFRAKSDADDEMIALLKRQNELQAIDMATMAADHADEIRKLKRRCDEAVRNEVEISGILNMTAKGIVEGLRKMRGNETPAVMPSAQARPADHPALPAPEIEDSDTANLRDILHRLPTVEFRTDARKVVGLAAQ